MTTVEPKVVERPAQPYVGVRERLSRVQLASVVPRLMFDVSRFLQRQRVSPVGPPLVRYLTVDYRTGAVEIEAGLSVSDSVDVPDDDRFRLGTIPAGRYAVVNHVGPYEKLVDTTAALLEWGKRTHVRWDMNEKDRVTRWQARVERYEIGPPTEPSPTKWRTEIAILVAA